ncbi:MAG: Stp1/IreP family PP2C-type Ser/Thr phosphatase [Bacteroidetes bacterium]|nr:Stp1/IreP family PP2C-type Ser/Thr phosphatase [Bacteroidota bacterium]MBM3424736.1 Stp1/IreP family PP2C-type Ser/Thr phosphatase [Bacteroidota bacterium]
MEFEFKEHTDKGLVREVNEDNLGHSLGTRNGDIFVVCDGMGGHVGGKTASTIGVNAILGELSQKEHGNMHVAISQSLLFANEQVLGHAAADPSLKGMGSTATVAIIKDDLLYLGHVGDSRAYIFSDGKLYRITRDDSFVQQLVDSGAITEDEAESHPQKNRILQALGSTSTLTPRIPNKPFKLKKDDLLMLCSDGLTSMVVDDLIEQLINPNNLEGTISDLHRIAMNNGGKDNITITLIKVTTSIHDQSEFDHFTRKYLPIGGEPIISDPPEPFLHENQKKNRGKILLLCGVLVFILVLVGYVFLYDGEKSKNPTNEENRTVPKDTSSSTNIEQLFTDTDNDGVNDNKDNCPNEKGPASNKGCPIKETDNSNPTKKKIDQSVQSVKNLCDSVAKATDDLKKAKFNQDLIKKRSSCIELIKKTKNGSKWQKGWKEEIDCECNNDE